MECLVKSANGSLLGTALRGSQAKEGASVADADGRSIAIAIARERVLCLVGCPLVCEAKPYIANDAGGTA